jgi:hypothetical protein
MLWAGCNYPVTDKTMKGYRRRSALLWTTLTDLDTQYSDMLQSAIQWFAGCTTRVLSGDLTASCTAVHNVL